MPATAIQNDLQCTRCGSQCRFVPVQGALVCDSCGNAAPIAYDETADPSAEQHYHPDLPHTEQKVFAKARSHNCTTCGGEVVFTGPALSERCAYCDGPVVLGAQDASYEALGLIPFAIPYEIAADNALRWAKARLAAPNDLGAAADKGRMAGIYVPFWTFDSQEVVFYTVTYKVKLGKTTVTRHHKDMMQTAFDDLLVPASHHVTPLIRDGILHDFDPELLRPYDAAYLAGFAADRHQATVKHGLDALADDKDVLLRNKIKWHSGKSRITKISYTTSTSGIHYRRILLPVWILHYTYASKPRKIVVCGIQGRTFGERPFSFRKLVGYAAIAATAVIAFGWFWGAAQFA